MNDTVDSINFAPVPDTPIDANSGNPNLRRRCDFLFHSFTMGCYGTEINEEETKKTGWLTLVDGSGTKYLILADGSKWIQATVDQEALIENSDKDFQKRKDEL